MGWKVWENVNRRVKIAPTAKIMEKYLTLMTNGDYENRLFGSYFTRFFLNNSKRTTYVHSSHISLCLLVFFCVNFCFASLFCLVQFLDSKDVRNFFCGSRKQLVLFISLDLRICELRCLLAQLERKHVNSISAPRNILKSQTPQNINKNIKIQSVHFFESRTFHSATIWVAKFKCGTWHDYWNQAILFVQNTTQDDESTKVNDAHWNPSGKKTTLNVVRLNGVRSWMMMLRSWWRLWTKNKAREREKKRIRRYVDEMNVSANSSKSKISINTVSNNGCVYFFVSNFYEGIVLRVYIRFHWNAPDYKRVHNTRTQTQSITHTHKHVTFARHIGGKSVFSLYKNQWSQLKSGILPRSFILIKSTKLDQIPSFRYISLYCQKWSDFFESSSALQASSEKKKISLFFCVSHFQKQNQSKCLAVHCGKYVLHVFIHIIFCLFFLSTWEEPLKLFTWNDVSPSEFV